jgi:hypothetical protein
MLAQRSVHTRRFAAGFLAAAISACVAAACGGEDAGEQESELVRAQRVIDGVERPVDRLQDALAEARVRSTSSMVEVRAAAERAADDLEDAATELRTLNAEAATEDDEAVSDAEDALDELADVATSLSARSSSPTRIEEAAAQAQLAADELDALRVPELDASDFVAAVRRARRPTSTDPPAVVGAPGGGQESIGGSTFNTGRDPGEATAAAYCRAVPGELRCWTPNDGFTVVLDETGARRERASEAGNRGYEPGTPTLALGGSWSAEGFGCESTPRALSCTNGAGHGFTLPRYRGLPSYF